ncbi:MAG: hypothetical protein ACRCX8_13895 [Sarcina sp.]
MVKVWKDLRFEEDIDTNKEFEKLMQQVPNFDKREGLKKIYQENEYIILQAKRGFVVYNTKKNFDKGHTHLRSYNMSKTIIDNCIGKKRPRTNSEYLIQSHIRLSKDESYTKYLNEIKEAINGRESVKYVNVNSKKIK